MMPSPDSFNMSIGSSSIAAFEEDDSLIITTLYVHNIDKLVPQQEILELFEQFGELEQNECIFFNPQRISSSYAFIRYRIRQDAEVALEQMNNVRIGSLNISIKWSDSCDQRTSIHLTFNPKNAKPGFHKQVFHKCREFGKVNHYNIPRRKGVVPPATCYEGFGFVHFKDSYNGRSAAQVAIDYFKKNDVGGVKVNCCFSKKKLNPTSMPPMANAIINDLNSSFNSSLSLSSSGGSINSQLYNTGKPSYQNSGYQSAMVSAPTAVPIPLTPFSSSLLSPSSSSTTSPMSSTSSLNTTYIHHHHHIHHHNDGLSTSPPPPPMSSSSSTSTSPNISPNLFEGGRGGSNLSLSTNGYYEQVLSAKSFDPFGFSYNPNHHSPPPSPPPPTNPLFGSQFFGGQYTDSKSSNSLLPSERMSLFSEKDEVVIASCRSNHINNNIGMTQPPIPSSSSSQQQQFIQLQFQYSNNGCTSGNTFVANQQQYFHQRSKTVNS